MSAPRFVWSTAIVEAIDTLTLDAIARVSYVKCARCAGVDIHVTVVSEDAEEFRTLIIRQCSDDPNTVEIVEEGSNSRQLVPCVNAHEFRAALQRTIVEWIPENLDAQFVQLMDDLRCSESDEELQRQLRSLVDPAARAIVEELIALRKAVEDPNPTREEKRDVLRRTNQFLVMFAQYLASRDCSATPRKSEPVDSFNPCAQGQGRSTCRLPLRPVESE